MNEPIRNELRAKRDSFPRSERGVWERLLVKVIGE